MTFGPINVETRTAMQNTFTDWETIYFDRIMKKNKQNRNSIIVNNLYAFFELKQFLPLKDYGPEFD